MNKLKRGTMTLEGEGQVLYSAQDNWGRRGRKRLTSPRREREKKANRTILGKRNSIQYGKKKRGTKCSNRNKKKKIDQRSFTNWMSKRGEGER